MADTAKTEAKKEDIKFEYEGETYVLDADVMDDLELLEYIEDEDYVKAARQMVGRAQWTKFKNSVRGDKGKVSAAAAGPFVEALFEAVGN